MKGIHVTSEIKPLKKVLLHRPGRELLNLTPDKLQELLFDDIPFLKVAQKEHDAFAEILRENGVEVVYLEDLMAETLKRLYDESAEGVKDAAEKVSETVEEAAETVEEAAGNAAEDLKAEAEPAVQNMQEATRRRRAGRQ